MSDNILQLDNLKAGQFYGEVPRKRVIQSSILSEVKHKCALDIPLHYHELASFTLVLRGGYTENFGNKIYQHSPMSILWRRAEVVHKDRLGKDGVHFFAIEIQPNSLENMSSYSKIPEGCFEQNSSLIWLAYRLYYEFKNWDTFSEMIAEGITLEMLGHCARIQLSDKKRPPLWLLRVVEKLNEEYRNNLSNEELALVANVHPIYLATTFRHFYHQSIGEYVQKLRIDCALQLLYDKELPLTNIAHLVGFSDQSHFTRVFKRLIGVTPGAFRSLIN